MTRRFEQRSEPAPQGGWFEPNNTQGRRRAARFLHVGSIGLGVAVALAGLFVVMTPQTGPADPTIAAMLTVGVLAAGGLTYILADNLGRILTGIAWGALLHDLRLRSVWAILLEVALFLAALAMEIYSLNDAIRNGSTYCGLVAALLFSLTFWPFIRHRIRHGRWPAQH